MPFDRVVVSSEEIEQIKPAPEAPPSSFHHLPSPVPWWARLSLSPLVLVLPVLCVVAVILRVAFRSQPPRVKYAWVSFLSTLLVVSGILTTVGTVLVASFAPIPALVNTGLPELDERSQFPTLPSSTDLSSADVSAQLKPLVIVVSPAVKLWNRQEVAASSFGAGVLLRADKDGYLFATANHVVNDAASGSSSATGHVLVATESGVWARADVVGQSPQLDLAMLWMARHSGSADFVQPIAAGRDGADIFVIGHPEGLRYTLSTGIISGLRDDEVQISAAVSPGNSGGPVYDHRGNLVGIVSSKFDRNRDANAENLSFAAKADGLLRKSSWTFRGDGQQRLDQYLNAIKNTRNSVSEAKNQGAKQD
jgi:S1-C subfamily serine protease